MLAEITKWFLEHAFKGSPMSRTNAMMIAVVGVAALSIWGFETLKGETAFHTTQIADLDMTVKANDSKAESRYLELLKVISDLRVDASSIQTAVKDLGWYVRSQGQPHRVP